LHVLPLSAAFNGLVNVKLRDCGADDGMHLWCQVPPRRGPIAQRNRHGHHPLACRHLGRDALDQVSPPSFPNLPSRGPRPEGTPEALPYPILICMSRLRIAAPGLAASCCGRLLLCAGDAAIAADAGRPAAEVCGGEGGVKSGFVCPSMLPLLSSPFAHFFSSLSSFLYNGGVTWGISMLAKCITVLI
jgi:hypothetical protein